MGVDSWRRIILFLGKPMIKLLIISLCAVDVHGLCEPEAFWPGQGGICATKKAEGCNPW